MMQNLSTAIFYWMIFSYAIWLPLGAAIGSAVTGFFQFLLFTAGIVCVGVILLLLAWLLLKADSTDRFGTRS